MAPLPVSEERVQAVYDLYVSNPALTYQAVADALGLTRGQVSHDMAAYRHRHGVSLDAQLRQKMGKERRTDVPKQEKSATIEEADTPPSEGMGADSALRESDEPRLRRRETARRVWMRGVVFDLETTDFGTEGYAGYVICCCLLPLDTDEVTTLSIRYEEHGDDRRLVGEIREMLNEYDILIGHNCQAFDLNWITSRLMFHGMPLLNTALVYDTYQVAKSLAIKTRKSLGNLLDYFGLEGEKTAIYRTSWNNIRSPYLGEFNTALSDITYHCEQDVIGNRNLFDALYPYSLSMKTNPFKVTKMVAQEWGRGQGA